MPQWIPSLSRFLSSKHLIGNCTCFHPPCDIISHQDIQIARWRGGVVRDGRGRGISVSEVVSPLTLIVCVCWRGSVL